MLKAELNFVEVERDNQKVAIMINTQEMILNLNFLFKEKIKSQYHFAAWLKVRNLTLFCYTYLLINFLFIYFRILFIFLAYFKQHKTILPAFLQYNVIAFILNQRIYHLLII